MKYTELTNSDLTAIQRDINQAVFWQSYVDFARKYYGDKVVKLECHTYGKYNDEGGAYYRIGEITAYDTSGNELEVDYDGPYFDAFKAAEIKERNESTWWKERYPDTWQDVDVGDMEEHYHEAKSELEIADEDEYTFTVDLTQQPKRPRIAIIEDDNE
jgi:hypothetical protein